MISTSRCPGQRDGWQEILRDALFESTELATWLGLDPARVPLRRPAGGRLVEGLPGRLPWQLVPGWSAKRLARVPRRPSRNRDACRC